MIIKDDSEETEIHERRMSILREEAEASKGGTFINGVANGVAGYVIRCMVREEAHTKMSLVNSFLALLSDDERLEAFSQFCRACGCDDPSCQCWNDD